MIDISKWAFRNKNLVYFLIAVLVIGGAYSCYQMSKLEDPEIKVKLAMVVTTYPGASAHQVELEVTDVLEKKIRTMGNIDNVESYSYNDLSIIQVELLSTVATEDVEQCWDMLRRKVNDACASLPDGAGTPVVKDDFGNVYGMFYALTGDGLSDRELSDYAELIKREVNELEGVDRVELYGKRSECINVSLLQDRMANLGVKPIEVLSTLNGQNQTNYTGYYDNGDNRVRVTVSDRFRTVEDIGAMLIQGHEDDQLRLRDIARIEKDYEEPTRNEMFRDGERALGILIAASSGSDIVKVGQEVDATLSRLKDTRLPAGVECHKIFYQPERVGDSLGTFVINLIESVIIVVLILMLTMGFKSGLIIGICLVVTVLGSFLFLHSAGGTMQRVSLAAFVLAMGMLVDNAIVIIDGILVDLKAGKERMEAMTAIGHQTAMPLLGATLIAIIAFLPIYMSPDTAGVYTRDLFIVLAVSLLLSWVLALVHVPLMADRRLHPAVETGAGGRRVYKGKTYAVLRGALRFGLAHRWGFVGCMVVLLLLSLFGYQYMRQGFFPDMEYDQLYMEYKLPEGNNYTRVEHDLAEIEAYLKGRGEVTHVTASMGGTPGRYNLVRSIANPSLAYGELIIDFVSPKALVENLDEIQDYLSVAYPDAYVKLKRYNLMFKKYPIEAQFLGPDPAVLHRLADSARAIMERTTEVCLVTSDWEPKVPVLTVEYDQPAARALGLSRSDVSMSILSAAGGIPVGSFYEGIHRNSIYLKCLDEQGCPIKDLGNTQVFSSMPSLGGLLDEETLVKLKAGSLSREDLVESLMGSTPLKQVCKGIDVHWEDPVVPRYNGQRSQRVQCSPAPGLETEKARQAIASQIERLELPDGYSLLWQGERNASNKSMKYLFRNFPLAIILMIAILIMLFKDYRKPAVIFCCIPLILIGVVAVMLLTGKTFNFVAIVGTLGLIGMLIKNGIVLMDEITLQINAGIEPVTALIDSSQSRLRPVMMASLTTIMGMIPLLSDAMFGSLAASIMGGLLCSTLITLLFIPVLYALFFRIRLDGPSGRGARRSLLVFLPLFLTGPLSAQDTLSLGDCRAMALKYNKELAAAVKQTENARYTALSYRGNFFPDFKLSGTGLYSTVDGSYGIAGGNLPTFLPGVDGQAAPNGGFAYFPGINLDYKVGWFYTGGIQLDQPLYMGGKIRAAYRMSVLGKQMAQANETLTATEVILQTDRAYAQVVKAREMKRVADAYHAVLAELRQNVESAHRHGLKPQNDVFKVQVRLNESELSVRKAENALRLATMSLCHLIGRPLTDDVRVSGDFPSVGLVAAETADISSRPEYDMARKQVDMARQQVRFNRSEMLPQVGVRGSYSYAHGVEVNNRTLLDKANFSVLLNVSVPLFHFGERTHKVNAARAKLAQTRLEQQDLDERMLLELTQAANNLDEARLESDLSDRSLVQAEENRRVSRSQYDAGLETLSDHLEAQALWQQAYETQVDAHFRHYLAYVAYLKAAGKLYPGSRREVCSDSTE